MQGYVAKKVEIEAKTGGSIYEIGHDDTRHEWGSVTTYSPSDKLVLAWHIGLSAEQASRVTVDFIVIDANKTKVVLTHDNWEAFGEKANDIREVTTRAGWVFLKQPMPVRVLLLRDLLIIKKRPRVIVAFDHNS